MKDETAQEACITKLFFLSETKDEKLEKFSGRLIRNQLFTDKNLNRQCILIRKLDFKFQLLQSNAND